MSVPSNTELGKTQPVEDKYKGQSTADLLGDDSKNADALKEDIELIEKEDEAPEDKEDLLADDKKEKKVKGEKEEDKEEKEIELEDTETAEGEEPVFPVPVKVITAKYPSLFKDFPFLKKAMFRDKEYTEMFGTIGDAKEALDSKERLETIQRDVFEGNISDILTEVKQTNQEAFNKLVDNYLPALQKADQAAFLTVIGNVGSGIVQEWYKNAVATENEDMKKAAAMLHNFLFPGMPAQPIQRLAKEEPKKDDLVEQQRRALAEQQYNSTLNDVSTRITNTLRSTIDTYIDPKGQMSDYEKRGAIQDVLTDLDNQIGSDTYFKPYYDKLWIKAANNNYPSSDKDAIRKAYLARAKTLLPASIQRIRNEVLKGNNKTSKDDGKDRSGPVRPGRASTSSNKQTAGMTASEKAKTIPKNVSTLDYLNSDD